jgi:alpha-N-arabinofuranosidase
LNASNIRGRAVTLRDALASALTLDIFQQHADKLLVANFTGLINQEGGLFLADGDKFVATPIFHVFQLYSAHQGGQALRTQIDAPTLYEQKTGKRDTLKRLHGSASIKGPILTLTLVNPHASEACEPTILIRGGEVGSAEISALADGDIHARNTFENPDRVRPVASPLNAHGSRFTCRLPAASVNRLSLRLRG